MPRILACTTSPDDWKRFLADPEKHWRTGYSVKALAHSWEAAEGMPPEVLATLSNAPDHVLDGAEALLAVPENATDLPGGDRPSRCRLRRH